MGQILLVAAFFMGLASVAVAGGIATSPWEPMRTIRKVLGNRGVGVLMIVGIALCLGGLIGVFGLLR